jgi:hypothetical protein
MSVLKLEKIAADYDKVCVNKNLYIVAVGFKTLPSHRLKMLISSRNSRKKSEVLPIIGRGSL